MDFAKLKENLKERFHADELEDIPESETTINISAVELAATQKIVISISKFKDKLFFDMRHWFRQEAGNWIPTKKGVHLPLDKSFQIAEILEAIKSLQ